QIECRKHSSTAWSGIETNFFAWLPQFVAFTGRSQSFSCFQSFSSFSFAKRKWTWTANYPLLRIRRFSLSSMSTTVSSTRST
ncbi:hypothetical protein PMAYCL1PPCAC_32264, partial [Pristionchus mayeri]